MGKELEGDDAMELGQHEGFGHDVGIGFIYELGGCWKILV